MIIRDIIRRDKLQRFIFTLRQEGFRSAIAKTARYLQARRTGSGLSSLFRLSSQSKSSGERYLDDLWLDLAKLEAFHLPQSLPVLQSKPKVALIGDLNLSQCRKYRVEQMVELWRSVGVECEFAHYEDVEHATAILQDASHLMLYRLASSPVTSMLLYEARRLRLPVLYDLDDPLFSVSAYGTYQNMEVVPAAQRRHFLREAPRYLDVMNASDLITVSTPAMIEHTKLYTARPVLLRRNFADQDTLRVGATLSSQNKGCVRARTFRVGFSSGSIGHEVDFATISEDLVDFLQASQERELVVLGHFDRGLLPKSLRSRVEAHPFTNYDEYLETLSSLDVSLMPLVNDQFNRCKSAVRIIDSAAVSVPSVVGTVSDMAHQVIDGVTGRVIEDGESWREALEQLEGDRKFCRSLGEHARKKLETDWTARGTFPVMDPILLDWVKRGK